MTEQPVVIKVGGNDLAKVGFIPALAEIVADLQKDYACIVVHGGGRAIDALMAALGIKPSYVEGQRVTDDHTLDAAEMVLSGQVNKRLVLALQDAGIDALGISGVDRGLIKVEPWDSSLGRVGKVISVRTEVLNDLCMNKVVPVISPISAGPGGRYNVNADHAAGAIAGAICANHAAFLTNIPGVQVNGGIAPQLTTAEIHRYIANGTIFGGMIPKVNAALAALEQCVARAVITDLPGLQAGTGTSIVP